MRISSGCLYFALSSLASWRQQPLNTLLSNHTRLSWPLWLWYTSKGTCHSLTPLTCLQALPRLWKGFDRGLKERDFCLQLYIHTYYSLLSSCPLYLHYTEQNDLFLSCKCKKCFRRFSVEREKEKGQASIPELSIISIVLQQFINERTSLRLLSFLHPNKHCL